MATPPMFDRRPTTLDRMVTIGPHAAQLDAIARADAALAIWWRVLPEAFRGMLAALELDAIDDVRVDVEAGEVIDGALHAAGYPDAAIPALAADIAALVLRHAALTGQDRLAVRLEVVETDACRRFHADYNTLRLLCTYVGPGTQWCCVEGQDAICEVPTGSVAVLKGRLLLDPPTILHRSPPIAVIGSRRLLLVIDPADPTDIV